MIGFYDKSIDEQLVDIQQLATESLSHWHFTNGTLSLIKHRENSVFELNCDQGRFALRVHRASYHSDSALRGELAWIDSLNQSNIAVPVPIKSIHGNFFETCQIDAIPVAHQVDVISWVEGTPFGAVEDILAGNTDEATLAKAYEQAGELAAKIHNHAQSFVMPSDATRQAWDNDGLLGADPIWGRGWENELLTTESKGIIIKARDKAIVQLNAFGKGSDRYSLIHADFLPENLFINGEGIEIIDFDDSGYGWHMFEIATALFWYLGEPVFDTIYQRFLTGYRKYRDMGEDQLEMLHTFFVIRGIVYLGWMHTRKETEIVQELGSIVVPAVVGLATQYIEEP